MRYNILLLAVICFLSSCAIDVPEENPNNSTLLNEMTPLAKTRSASNDIEYETLPNPYKLSIMQEVCDSLGIDLELEPTHLYVRFLPQDSTHLNILYNTYNLCLIPHPLDINLAEEEIYIDPNLSNTTFCWLYTTVPINFSFPTQVEYEILDQFYIPTDGETTMTRSGSYIDLEQIAFEHLGYNLNEGTRVGDNRPDGVFSVKNDVTGEIHPIKGARVICSLFGVTKYAYTDEYGRYEINAEFPMGPRYYLEFKNQQGFAIWGKYGYITPTTTFLSWRSSDGYSKTFTKSERTWRWAAINNAAYDYYKLCDSVGILKPPSNLRIWCSTLWGNSCAPMLSRIKNTIYYHNNNDFFTDFVRKFGINIVNELDLIRECVPDILVGTKSNNQNLNLKQYKDIYGSVGHELSHASHFKQVGATYWTDYISHIVSYGKLNGSPYGNGTEPTAGVCEIGEMWGYSFERIFREKYFDEYFSFPESLSWMHINELYYLYKNDILTFKQIFDCLTPNIRSVELLGQNLLATYPHERENITEVYYDSCYFPLEPYCDVLFDQDFFEDTISTNKNILGEKILFEHVHFTKNANIMVDASDIIVIKRNFSSEKGCHFSLNISSNN